MMKCEIIRDLLPSYIDGLTSVESNEEIEKHLNECGECRDYLGKMQMDIRNDEQKTGEKEGIQPFLKIREATLRKIMLAVLVTAVACSVAWSVFVEHYFGGKSVCSDEVEIGIWENAGVTTLSFAAKEEGKLIKVGYTDDLLVDGKKPVATLNLIKSNHFPWYYVPIENQYRMYFVDEDTVVELYSIPNEMDFDEDDFIAIDFDDGVKVIKLSDLRDGNIESLK